jgi:alanine dehydrogenase
MRVGVPREVKVDEYRVALTPAGADALVRAGHDVVMERGAGDGAGFDDNAYRAVGATIGDAAEAWGAKLVLKVKEP